MSHWYLVSVYPLEGIIGFTFWQFPRSGPQLWTPQNPRRRDVAKSDLESNGSGGAVLQLWEFRQMHFQRSPCFFFLFHIYSSNRNDLQNKMWPFKNEGLTPKTNVTTGFRLHTFDMQRQKWGFSHHGDLTTQICQMFCMEGRLAEMGRKCWSRSSEKMALPFFWTWNGLYTVRVYYTSIFSLVTHHCRWTTCIYFLTYSLGISSNVHAKVWPVRWCPPSK